MKALLERLHELGYSDGKTRVVPGSGGGIPGSGGWTSLGFWRFLSGRGLAIQTCTLSHYA